MHVDGLSCPIALTALLQHDRTRLAARQQIVGAEGLEPPTIAL